MVDQITVDGDCADRTCGTEILAGAAADAFLFFHGWNPDGLPVFSFFLYHLDSSNGAVACAVAALFDLPIVDEAEPRLYLGRSDFPLCLLLRGDLQDCPGRTDLGAFHTLRTAVTAFIGHLRLHQVLEVLGGPEDIVGTDCHAELACRAVFVELFHAF